MSIVNTEQGMIVRYRCVCGKPAEMLTRSGVRVSVHLDGIAVGGPPAIH
jgi:hypothetical protein